MPDKWNPTQYEQFKAQRSQPFFDLLALVDPLSVKRAVDLGCGTGELTGVLHKALPPGTQTRGVDSSPSMLARAAAFASDTLSFAASRIEDWSDADGVDLIFSNAALQWVPDHPALFARLCENLSPGGQLAIQMPANHDHLSHRLAAAIAAESPFVEHLLGYARSTHVLALESYAELFNTLGFASQRVSMVVYGHPMPSSRAVVEWVKGTLLLDYETRLPAEMFAAFLQRYTERLEAALGAGPYFYAFKRTLLHAVK